MPSPVICDCRFVTLVCSTMMLFSDASTRGGSVSTAATRPVSAVICVCRLALSVVWLLLRLLRLTLWASRLAAICVVVFVSVVIDCVF